MNTMRVGAEYGKSLLPVDLAGVGWLGLWCVANDLVAPQSPNQSASIPWPPPTRLGAGGGGVPDELLQE